MEWGWFGGLVVVANDLSPEDLLRWQDLIFSTGPITRLVVGVVEPGDAEMLLGCRYLHRVRSLALAGITSPEALGLARLAECPALAGLRGAGA